MVSRNTGIEVEDAAIVNPTILSNVIIVTIDGSKLQQDKLYRVLVSFDATPAKRMTCMTMLKCIA